MTLPAPDLQDLIHMHYRRRIVEPKLEIKGRPLRKRFMSGLFLHRFEERSRRTPAGVGKMFLAELPSKVAFLLRQLHNCFDWLSFVRPLFCHRGTNCEGLTQRSLASEYGSIAQQSSMRHASSGTTAWHLGGDIPRIVLLTRTYLLKSSCDWTEERQTWSPLMRLFHVRAMYTYSISLIM